MVLKRRMDLTQLKPIFHQKNGLRWVPDANEIYTKKHEINVHARRENVALAPNANF